MAIVVGDIVSPHMASALLPRTVFGPGVQPHPPIFGIVDAFADPDAIVLWFGGAGGGGSLVAAIDDSSLDVIEAPSAAEVTRLQGRMVKVDPDNAEWSPEFQGRVVSLYIRDLSGDDSPTSTLALLRLGDGTYLEIQSDQLIVAPGR